MWAINHNDWSSEDIFLKNVSSGKKNAVLKAHSIRQKLWKSIRFYFWTWKDYSESHSQVWTGRTPNIRQLWQLGIKIDNKPKVTKLVWQQCENWLANKQYTCEN